MKQILKNNFYIVLIIFFTFILDIFSVVIFNKYLVEALLSFLIVLNLYKKLYLINFLILFLLSLESFLVYGFFGFTLIPLLLLIFIINKTKIYICSNRVLSISYLLIYLFFQDFIFKKIILDIDINLSSFKNCVLLNLIIINILLEIIPIRYLNKT